MAIRPFVLNSNMPQPGSSVDYKQLTHAVDHNTGNAYITYVVSKTLYGTPTVFPGIANLWQDMHQIDPEALRQQGYTHIFLMMKDHIRESFFDLPWEKLARLLQQIDLPLVVFGLGANSFGGYDRQLHAKLPSALRRCLQLMAERSTSLGIRGEFTAGVLAKLGITNVSLIGCPSYYEQGPTRTVQKTGWNPNAGVIANGAFSSERHPQQLHYMIQDDVFVDRPFFKALLQPGALEAADIAMVRHPALRSYFTHAVEALEQGRMSLFINFEQWQQFARARFNLAIGGRVHGAIAALNAGIPAIVTNRDSRTHEMCALLGIPHRPELQGASDLLDLAHLYNELDLTAMNARYETLYKNYSGWLAQHHIVPEPARAAPESMPVTVQFTTDSQRAVCAQQIRQKLAMKSYPLWLWYAHRALQHAVKTVRPTPTSLKLA